MRKLTLVLAACFALLAVSCQKDAELPDGGPAQFSAAAIGDTYFPKLAKNGSQKISFCASTEDNGVKEQCIATFKIGDASLVDVYNASVPQEMKGKAFPEGACAFEKNDVTIDRFNRNSRTATLTVTNTPSMEGDTLYVLPIKLSTVTGSKNASADSNAVVFFTFYALNLDKGKGSVKRNWWLSENRARVVYECLVNEFGINPKQLTTDYKGGVDDMYYDDPKLSRSVIVRAIK